MRILFASRCGRAFLGRRELQILQIGGERWFDGQRRIIYYMHYMLYIISFVQNPVAYTQTHDIYVQVYLLLYITKPQSCSSRGTRSPSEIQYERARWRRRGIVERRTRKEKNRLNADVCTIAVIYFIIICVSFSFSFFVFRFFFFKYNIYIFNFYDYFIVIIIILFLRFRDTLSDVR